MSDKKIIDALKGLLADAVVYYYKLHHYHWHVKGKQFFALHAKFEEYYEHWADVLDDVAERILTIGGTALPTLQDVLKHTNLKEDPEFPGAEEMVVRLTKDLEKLTKSALKVRDLAVERGDDGTTDMMNELCDVEYKNLWMLHAFLKD
jgi:starvation-inducible DNA-binding protein